MTVSGPIQSVPIRFTAAELEYLHKVLTDVKNAATRDGRIYSMHATNASLRTRIEQAATNIRESRNR